MDSKADNLIRSCIWDQGDALGGLVDISEIDEFMAAAHEAGQDLWCLVGCGTSYHASLVAQDLARSIGGVNFVALSAPEFIDYYSDSLIPRTTLVAVTQSGDSIATLNAIESYFRRGGKVAAVYTAYPERIGMHSGLYSFSLDCAGEVVGPKTKGFTLSLAMLYNLVLAVQRTEQDGISEPLSPTEGVSTNKTVGLLKDEMYASLRRVGAHMRVDLQANDEGLRRAASSFADCDLVVVAGAGLGKGLALEIALKIMEMAKVPAIGVGAEEALHGLSNGLDQRTGFVLLSGDEPSIQGISRVEQMAMRIGAGAILSLGPLPLDGALSCCYTWPGINVLYPFSMVPLAQWFCYNLAIVRGQVPSASRYPGLRAAIKLSAS